MSGEEHANIEYVFVLLPSDPVSPPPHTISHLFRPCRHLSYSQPSPLLVHFAHSHIRLRVLTHPHPTQNSPNPRILLHLGLSNPQRRLALTYHNGRRPAPPLLWFRTNLPWFRTHLVLRPSFDPLIDPAYNSNPLDVAVLVAGIRFCGRSIKVPPYGDAKGIVYDPKGDMSDQEVEEFVRPKVEPFYRPVCVVGMLPKGEEVVVYGRLRVYGVRGLRVVDAWVILLVSCCVHGNGVWRWRICADAVYVTLQQLSARIQHTIYAIAEKVRFWLSRYFLFHASLTVVLFFTGWLILIVCLVTLGRRYDQTVPRLNHKVTRTQSGAGRSTL